MLMCTWIALLLANTCPLLLIRPMQVPSGRALKECARASAWYTFYRTHLNRESLHALNPTGATCKKGLSYWIYNKRFSYSSLKPLPMFGTGSRKDMVQGVFRRIAM